MGKRLTERSCLCWVVASMLVVAGGASAGAAVTTVRYRSVETIYLAAGSNDSLEPGARLEVVRDGEVIGELELFFVAEHSSSSRLVSEKRTIVAGDVVRTIEVEGQLEGEERQIELPEDPGGTIELLALEPTQRAETVRTGELVLQPAELALAADPVEPLRWQPGHRNPYEAGTRVSGTVNLGWESSIEGQRPAETDFQRLGGRLNLSVRDIGGRPYEVRARLRLQQVRRTTGLESEVDDRDRFYELSLTYDPPQGRWAYRVGRMSSSPFIGIGYFDGAIGQFAVSSIFEVGAFAGTGAEIEESGFSTSRAKYGAFGRFTASTTDSGYPWEVVVGAVREHGEEDISREYVTLQSRYSAGGRWSFFQRAEVDLNRGWREEVTGSSSQLSNLSIAATAHLSRYGRLTLAYDRYEQYRTEETRDLPEDLFRDLQRQGLRANLQFGSPRSLNFALSASLRDQSGGEAETLSYGFWVRHGRLTPWRLAMAFNYVGFSNEFTDGYITTLTTSKRLRSGHQIDLLLGSKLSGNEVFVDDADERTNWARLRGWVELPRSFYATGEYEYLQGETLDGQRLFTGFGYRF